MKLSWEAKYSGNSSHSNVSANPLAVYILRQRNLGVSRSALMDKLMKEGVPYRNIRKAFIAVDGARRVKKNLDWSSPTAINETARQIRKDIRLRRVSYKVGMETLIRARNVLLTLIKNPRLDKRVAQMNQEVRTTKRLLMKQYGNPEMIKQYHIRTS